MATIETFYDPATFTLTYVVFDENTKDAVVIDPVLDYDPLSSQTSTKSADEVVDFVKKNNLNLKWVLETHAHADHLSASQYLKNNLGAKIAIGERIKEVQGVFKNVFDLPTTFRADGSQFDELLKDGQSLEAGSLRVGVISTPGHTPACVTFKVDDAVFTGDALFMEDYGTGRCDFPKGSAEQLYESVHDKLYNLPDNTRVFVGHDYQPGGRELKYETTIGISKQKNIQLRTETTREEYVAFRNNRDAGLTAPRLLFQSVQVNIDAGKLPETHANGLRYFRMPLNMKKPTNDAGEPSNSR